jgi:hypothetical protein
MTLRSKENYINAVATKREMSFHRLDCWRGLPNNRLRDPAGKNYQNRSILFLAAREKPLQIGPNKFWRLLNFGGLHRNNR